MSRIVISIFLCYPSNEGYVMGRKAKIIPHIPATMEEVAQAIFRPNAEFAKKQRELRKKEEKKKSNKTK